MSTALQKYCGATLVCGAILLTGQAFAAGAHVVKHSSVRTHILRTHVLGGSERVRLDMREHQITRDLNRASLEKARMIPSGPGRHGADE